MNILKSLIPARSEKEYLVIIYYQAGRSPEIKTYHDVIFTENKYTADRLIIGDLMMNFIYNDKKNKPIKILRVESRPYNE